MSTVRGFILQASYRVTSGGDGRRAPVVQLYGRLENGQSFLVRDNRQRPHFYVRAADAAKAAQLRAGHQSPTDRRTFDGEAVVRIEVEVPSDVPPLRDRLHDGGIETFEADVRFAIRYLIERGIKGGCEIEGGSEVEGEAAPVGGLARVFDNPVLRPADVSAEPRVLSFDIETDSKSERLLAISLFAPGIDEVLIVDGSDRPCRSAPPAARPSAPRSSLFAARLRAFDPDVITGWNIIDFDLSVLERIAARLDTRCTWGASLARCASARPRAISGAGRRTSADVWCSTASICCAGAFVRMDDYSLDAVAREVLGEGKAVAGDARDRLGEIVHNYKHDLPAFALYARTDARLAYQIVEKLRLVELAFARSRLTGMTPDRVAASIASFDFLYLTELERVRIVAPSVRGKDRRLQTPGFTWRSRAVTSWSRSRACTPTYGYSTSRACIRVSFEHSTSTPSATCLTRLLPGTWLLPRISSIPRAESSGARPRSCRGSWTSFSRAARPPRSGATMSRRTRSRS